MISSTANAKIKHVLSLVKKAKARKEEGLFVVEGVRMFAELPKERIEEVFVSESFLKRPEHEKLLSGVRYETVTDEAFVFMSDTQTPQGVLALARQYAYTVEDLLSGPGPAHLILLETIQDPGNLGTVLRAGEGAGITGAVMDRGTADIYNPKVTRSTMGSICRVPFVYADDFAETLARLKRRGVRLFAADLSGRNNYDQADYTGNIGFLIGNEAGGLSEEALSLADERVKIPMAGRVESLNAAVASSILMFEAARQRRR